ncbi:MAG: peptide deformylase [Bacteroidales bacterium]|nr:peptide deformylase [Bacteroidales bacterium]
MRNVLLLTAFAALFAVASCSNGETRLSASERALINDGEGPMRVTTINDREDSILLRTPSVPIPVEEVKSEEIRTLLARMLATVTSPEQDGVGIAAPQVGINRRITLVMRYDKPGQPFEPFVNMQIDSLYGTVNLGPEGCLSVPGLRGDVPRWSDVIVSWTDTASLERRREHITGYTAIICQHEHDHLDGILYIDKAENLR